MSILTVDIGGTKIRVGLVEGERVTRSASAPTPASEGGARLLEVICELAADFEGYRGVGVAAAGVIDNGTVVSATDLIKGWAGTDIAGELSARLGVPVSVLGDVHAHGMGEATIGAGANYPSCLTVAVGTGIGGALVEDGQVHRGAHSLGGHIGHMDAVEAAGLACSCGREGHIEPLASGSGVAACYEALTGEAASGREIDARARAGEAAAQQVLYGSARALGRLLGSVANMVDPGVIVLSGSMTRSGDAWWEALREGYAASAMNLAQATPLREGVLGDDAPLLGAAVQFRKEHD